MCRPTMTSMLRHKLQLEQLLQEPAQKPAREWDTSSTLSSSSSTADIGSLSDESSSNRVQFGSIQIREYDRLIDVENVEVSTGLTLGWEFEQKDPVLVDEYNKMISRGGDQHHPQSSKKSKKQRFFLSALKSSSNKNKKSKELQPTTWEERRHLLTAFGYTKEEIAMAERERLDNLIRVRMTAHLGPKY